MPGHQKGWILPSHGQARLRWRTAWESKFPPLSTNPLHGQSLVKYTIRWTFPYPSAPHLVITVPSTCLMSKKTSYPHCTSHRGWSTAELLSHEPDSIYMTASLQCKSDSLSPVEKGLNEKLLPLDSRCFKSRKRCWPHSCPTTTRPSVQGKASSPSAYISTAIKPMTYGWDGSSSDLLQKTMLGNGPERPWNKGSSI